MFLHGRMGMNGRGLLTCGNGGHKGANSRQCRLYRMVCATSVFVCRGYGTIGSNSLLALVFQKRSVNVSVLY